MDTSETMSIWIEDDDPILANPAADGRSPPGLESLETQPREGWPIRAFSVASANRPLSARKRGQFPPKFVGTGFIGDCCVP